MSLRIAQISDLHLGAEEELTFGVSAREQFLRILSMAVDREPDLIWVTGDLCLDEPNEQIYPWVKGHLDQTGIPYRVIAGNHDDSIMLSQSFHKSDLKNRELYYSERVDGQFIVYLDSSKGRFSKNQWSWFRQELTAASESPHIVMHHPPIYAGTTYMDNRYLFIDQDEFIELLNEMGKTAHVYCGHYHLMRYVQHDNVHVHICPSTLFQMNSNRDEFQMQTTNPGFSFIKLDGNRVEVEVIWERT